jgi:hypothetical protein
MSVGKDEALTYDQPPPNLHFFGFEEVTTHKSCCLCRIQGYRRASEGVTLSPHPSSFLMAMCVLTCLYFLPGVSFFWRKKKDIWQLTRKKKGLWCSPVKIVPPYGQVSHCHITEREGGNNTYSNPLWMQNRAKLCQMGLVFSLFVPCLSLVVLLHWCFTMKGEMCTFR